MIEQVDCPYCMNSYNTVENPDGYCGRVSCHMKHKENATTLDAQFKESWFYIYGTLDCPDQKITMRPWKLTYQQATQLAEWARENSKRPDKKGKRI